MALVEGDHSGMSGVYLLYIGDGGAACLCVFNNQMGLVRTHSGSVVTKLNWNTADHLPQ